MSNNIPEFIWDKETGHAKCIIRDGKNVFIGEAFCHPDDIDMMGEKTGCTIALYRAEIKFYVYLRDNEIKPALNALKQYYYSIDRSKYFNEKSYEVKMLKRQISQKEVDLIAVKDLLEDTRNELRKYIDDKEKVFNKFRAYKKAKLN